MVTDLVPPFADDAFRRVLCVVAHPDDVEYGISSVIGSWDVEFPAGLNQADHRVAGLAALDALRDAGNRWVFPELLDEGLQPHSVRWLLAGGDPRPTHGVDVTGEPLERGIASLEAH